MKKSKEQVDAEAELISETFKLAYKLGYDDAVKDIKEPEALSSKDMEFEEWLNYLINVLAGVFQINPEEINFPNKGGGATHFGNETHVK